MIVFVSSTGSTGPAKLILAKPASHMIASLVLFNSSAAHGTHRDVVFVGDGPTLQLLIQDGLTACPLSMPFLAAQKADPS